MADVIAPTPWFLLTAVLKAEDGSSTATSALLTARDEREARSFFMEGLLAQFCNQGYGIRSVGCATLERYHIEAIEDVPEPTEAEDPKLEEPIAKPFDIAEEAVLAKARLLAAEGGEPENVAAYVTKARETL